MLSKITRKGTLHTDCSHSIMLEDNLSVVFFFTLTLWETELHHSFNWKVENWHLLMNPKVVMPTAKIFRTRLPVSNIWNNHLPQIIAPGYYLRKDGKWLKYHRHSIFHICLQRFCQKVLFKASPAIFWSPSKQNRRKLPKKLFVSQTVLNLFLVLCLYLQ